MRYKMPARRKGKILSTAFKSFNLSTWWITYQHYWYGKRKTGHIISFWQVATWFDYCIRYRTSSIQNCSCNLAYFSPDLISDARDRGTSTTGLKVGSSVEDTGDFETPEDCHRLESLNSCEYAWEIFICSNQRCHCWRYGQHKSWSFFQRVP